MQYDFSEDIWFHRCEKCSAEIVGGTRDMIVRLIDRHNKKVHND